MDGGWGEYGSWGECSAECGGGTQSRTRSCNNPQPANGGETCMGEATESKDCNPDPCPGKISLILSVSVSFYHTMGIFTF